MPQELQNTTLSVEKSRRQYSSLVRTRKQRQEKAQKLHLEMQRWMGDCSALRGDRREVRSRRAPVSIVPGNLCTSMPSRAGIATS